MYLQNKYMFEKTCQYLLFTFNFYIHELFENKDKWGHAHRI